MKNYIKEYFSCEEHDLTSLINKSSNTDDKIKLIKNEIMKLQKELEEKYDDLHSRVIKIEQKVDDHIKNEQIHTKGGNDK